MGYPTKIQQIKRENYNQYFVNLPRALAKALGIRKGEIVEWEIVDKNTLLLKREEKSDAR